jgi:hypothetical protein
MFCNKDIEIPFNPDNLIDVLNLDKDDKRAA